MNSSSSSKQGGTTSIFSNLKKLASRNDSDSDSIDTSPSIYTSSRKKRQPSVASFASSTSTFTSSSNNNNINTSSNSISPRINEYSDPASPRTSQLSYKDINALTDIKPIPTLKPIPPPKQKNGSNNTHNNHHSSSTSTLGNKHQSNISVSTSTTRSPKFLHLRNSTSHGSMPTISHPIQTSNPANSPRLSSSSTSVSLASSTGSPDPNKVLVGKNSSNFKLEMPDDPNEVDRQFAELMKKRDFKSLPEAARKQMQEYTTAKKWVMIYQDLLGDHERHSRYSIDQSPDYYVSKLIENSISYLLLTKLSVNLRTENVDWANEFMYHQGLVALSNVVGQMHSRKKHYHINVDEYLEREYLLMKCIRCALNIDSGINVVLEYKSFVPSLVDGMLSPRLATRKLVTDVFVFLCNWDFEKAKQIIEYIPKLDFNQSYNLPIKGMDKYLHKYHNMKSTFDHPKTKFNEWFKVVSNTLDSRGKMGSMVGASEEYKNHSESIFNEYITFTMILINSMISSMDNFRARIHFRTQLQSSGLPTLMRKFESLDLEPLNNAIYDYETKKASDQEELIKSDRTKNIDLSDPVELVNNMWSSIKGTNIENYFLSTIQHFFMAQADPMKSNDHNELSRTFRMIDGIVSGISMYSSTGSVDDDAPVNIAIQRLYNSMQLDDTATKAIMELKKFRKMYEETCAERDLLSKQLSTSTDGMVQKLEAEVSERDKLISRQRKIYEQLTYELDDLKKKHLQEKQQQELEMREIFLSIDAEKAAAERAAAIAAAKSPFESVDVLASYDTRNNRQNTEIVKNLNKRLSVANEVVLEDIKKKLIQKKNDYKQQSRKWNKTVEANSRLQSLRDQMDNLGKQARELEMTEFEDHPRKVSITESNKEPVSPPPPTPPPKNFLAAVKSNDDREALEKRKQQKYEEDLKKLKSYRSQLDSLQSESNDIVKFNSDKEREEFFSQLRNYQDERLNKLKAGFAELNKDFSIPEFADMANSNDDDANSYLLQLREKLSEVEGMKLELSSKLQEISEKEKELAAKESFDKIEQKYIGGKQAIPEADVSSSSVIGTGISLVKDRKQSAAFSPVLEEIVKKQQGIVNIKLSNDVPVISKIDEVDEIDEAGLPADKKSVELSDLTVVSSPAPPPAPPMPEMLKSPVEGSSVSNTSPLPPDLHIKVDEEGPEELHVPAALGDMSPPPPPLPPMLSPTSPPPPPMPSLLSPGGINNKRMSIFTAGNGNDSFLNYPRPKRKLKQLHWDKLDNTEDSVWDDDSGETFANDLFNKGIFSEMEEMFAAKEIKKIATKKSGEITKITFLPRDMNQHFGINLHNFSNLSDEETILKILSCDESVLNSSNVLEFLARRNFIEIPNTLARNLEPYSTDWTLQEEGQEVKKPEKDPAELQRADRIYLELIYNLQHYWPARSRALIVITNFEKDYSTLVSKLQRIDEAVEAINNSDNIRYVFKIILAFGNYMNDSGKQAKGFKLSTLQRLSFMKDDKNSMTFLHYVEKIIRQVYPEFGNFMEELRSVNEAANLSIEVIESDCNEYYSSIFNVERLIDIGSLSDSSLFHPKDEIYSVVLPKLPEAKRKAELLTEQNKIIVNGFSRLMKFFGENPNDNFAKNSFFKKFADFMSDYKKAQTDNMKREEEFRVYEQRKLMIEKSNEEKQAQMKQRNVSSNAKGVDAVMDTLLAKLKQVGANKGDPSSAKRKALARKKLMEAKKNSFSLNNLDEILSSEDSYNQSRNDDDTSFDEANSSGVKDTSFVSTDGTLIEGLNQENSFNEGSVNDANKNIISDRARFLLQSLRTNSDVSLSGEGKSAAQQLRQQRRLKRQQQKDQKDEDETIANDSIADEEDEESLIAKSEKNFTPEQPEEVNSVDQPGNTNETASQIVDLTTDKEIITDSEVTNFENKSDD